MRENPPYLSAFSPDVGKSSVSLRIRSKCGKIRTRKSPNTDTFRTVRIIDLLFFYLVSTNSVQKLPPITLHQYFNVKFVKLWNGIFLKIALNLFLNWKVFYHQIKLISLCFGWKTFVMEKRKIMEPCLTPSPPPPFPPLWTVKIQLRVTECIFWRLLKLDRRNKHDFI